MCLGTMILFDRMCTAKILGKFLQMAFIARVKANRHIVPTHIAISEQEAQPVCLCFTVNRGEKSVVQEIPAAGLGVVTAGNIVAGQKSTNTRWMHSKHAGECMARFSHLILLTHTSLLFRRKFRHSWAPLFF